MPLFTLVGILSVIGFGTAIGILMADPGSGTSLKHNPGKLELVILVYAAGIAIYYVSKWIRARQGIRLDLAFSEIPPE